MSRKHTTAEFIAQAQAVHGDTFDYSGVQYVSQSVPVNVKCRIHGDFFPTPKKHIHEKTGCPRCARTKTSLEAFLAAAVEVHGTRYDYSKVLPRRAHDPVIIVCPTHGEFSQVYAVHLKGSGCPKCAGVAKKSTEEFVAEARKVHGDRYDYSTATYVGAREAINIRCRTHGVFSQAAGAHLAGANCSVCAKSDAPRQAARDRFAAYKESLTARGLPYTYEFSETNNLHSRVLVTCDKGHTFEQRADGALRYGCPICMKRQSRGEQELKAFIESLGVRVERTRKIAAPKELDAWCPDHAIGFEFNGLYYHSDAFPDARRRHYDKSKLVESAGGRLVHIWSDDWTYRRSAVESLIKAALGLLPKLGARECTVAPVSADDAKTFLNTYHVQGYTSAVYLGLWHGGVLVACMGFAPARSARGEPAPGVFELVRYAASHRVAGGGSKLLQAWVRSMRTDGTQWTSLVTYCDLAQFSGKLYTGMGFTLVKRSGPDYKIIKAGADRRLHKSNVQKAKLKVLLGDKYDDSKTEAQMCAENYIYRIWDSGKLKFELRNHTV